MKIAELDLVKLGFDKVVITPEESGDPTGYYFYEYPLSDNNSELVLISTDSDEVKNDNWVVKIFDTDDYVFDKREDLKELIEMFNKFRII